MLYQNTRQLYTQTQHKTRLNYMGVLTQSGGKKSCIGKLPEPNDNILLQYKQLLCQCFLECFFRRILL